MAAANNTFPMEAWLRLALSVITFVLVLYIVAAQPWMKRNPYSALETNISELSGWSALNTSGNLLVHMYMRDEISNPRVMEVNVAGLPCTNITGNLASRGETDIHARCGSGMENEPYNGTITMTYIKSGDVLGTVYQFDYAVVGLFSGWRQ